MQENIFYELILNLLLIGKQTIMTPLLIIFKQITFM